MVDPGRFTVPRTVTPAETARIKDLRNPVGKMGKSGADGSGVIFLRDEPDVSAAKVRRAVTDSDAALRYDPAARPGVANLAVLLGSLTSRTPVEALVGLHRASALKEAVAGALIETLAPIQKLYAEFIGDRAGLLSLLRAGAAGVAADATKTVASARAAMGPFAVA